MRSYWRNVCLPCIETHPRAKRHIHSPLLRVVDREHHQDTCILDIVRNDWINVSRYGGNSWGYLTAAGVEEERWQSTWLDCGSAQPGRNRRSWRRRIIMTRRRNKVKVKMWDAFVSQSSRWSCLKSGNVENEVTNSSDVKCAGRRCIISSSMCIGFAQICHRGVMECISKTDNSNHVPSCHDQPHDGFGRFSTN